MTDVTVDASVIVAFEHGLDNLATVLQSLNPGKWPRIEFFLCSALPGDVEKLRKASAPNMHALQSPAGSRIPQLWRDGILAARGRRLGILSAHCVPDEDWVAAMLAAPIDDTCAGVGGYFSNAPNSDAVGWAIYLQRYAGYSLPRDLDRAGNIAADNAVYSRAAVLACPDLLKSGFWELEFHRRFFAAGRHLKLSAKMHVEHRNVYAPRQFIGQRYDHGIQFGAERGRRFGWLRRTTMILLSPAIPAVLYCKVIARSWRNGWLLRTPLAAYGWLAVFATAWGVGETCGMARPNLTKTIP